MKLRLLLLIALLVALPLSLAQPIITVDPVRDVLPGEAVYYPVTVTNTGDDAITVTLGLEGTTPWGFYRVDPRPTQLIEPRDAELYYIYLKAEQFAQTGTQDFTITATTDQGDFSQAPLRIAILREEQKSQFSWAYALLALLVIIAIIAAIAIAASIKPPKSSNGEGEEDDDFITFY